MVTVRHTLCDPVIVAEETMDQTAEVFDFLGFRDAARNLLNFRSGLGTPQNFNDADIEDHDPVLDAEDTNRTRFESRTFTGNTDGVKALLDLEDGETINFEDRFKRRIFGGTFDIAPGINKVLDLGTTIGDAALNPTTYVAFGRDEVLSNGDFEATREGDRLKIRGDGKIYISRAYATGGTELFPNQYEFFNNFEWRFIWSLSKGRGAGDTRVEPPKALLDLIAKTKEEPYERGVDDELSLGYFSSCAFKRAGAIWHEKLEDTSPRG